MGHPDNIVHVDMNFHNLFMMKMIITSPPLGSLTYVAPYNPHTRGQHKESWAYTQASISQSRSPSILPHVSGVPVMASILVQIPVSWGSNKIIYPEVNVHEFPNILSCKVAQCIHEAFLMHHFYKISLEMVFWWETPGHHTAHLLVGCLTLDI